MPLHYALGLLIAFYALLVLEFFVPSGGLLGIAAALCALASIVVGYTHSWTAGTNLLATVLISTPIVFSVLVRWWPKTQIGRRILNRRPGQLQQRVEKRTPDGTPLHQLIGKQGHAESHLLPSGRIRVGDEKLDAISIAGPIDSGMPVVIAEIVSGKIHVRPGEASDHRVDDPPDSRPASEFTERTFDLDDIE